MKHNVGGFDLTVRIVGGMVLLLIGLVAPISTLWQIVALAVAAVALITAVLHDPSQIRARVSAHSPQSQRRWRDLREEKM